jgi:hypothetical protein
MLLLFTIDSSWNGPTLLMKQAARHIHIMVLLQLVWQVQTRHHKHAGPANR